MKKENILRDIAIRLQCDIFRDGYGGQVSDRDILELATSTISDLVQEALAEEDLHNDPLQ